MSDIMKSVLEALLPEGAIWQIKPGGGFDLFYNGEAANLETIKLFLQKLANIRNPYLTELLDELEKEYGISPNPSLTDAEKRQNLATIMFGSDADGTDDFLEDQLQSAGFNAQVYQNDPAINPDILIDQRFRMVAGGFNAYAGRADAFARRQGGFLLVNGDLFTQFPLYEMQANGAIAFAGNASAVAGLFNDIQLSEIDYHIPDAPCSWPFIFFVGGNVVRNGVTNAIEEIENIIIPIERKQEFERMILKYKPLYTWCAYFAEFT